MGRRCFAHGPMDARGSFRGRPVLAPARDRCKSARRRTGYDRDRIDARYRIADDRGAQGRWADNNYLGPFPAPACASWPASGAKRTLIRVSTDKEMNGRPAGFEKASNSAQNTERRQILNDLAEMVSGQATELVGYLLDIDVLPRFLASEERMAIRSSNFPRFEICHKSSPRMMPRRRIRYRRCSR